MSSAAPRGQAHTTEENDAFEDLYKRHLCDVFRFIRGQVPNDSIAEDLTAQVFFQALRSASTYNGTGSYTSWLFQISRNSITTWYRNKGRDITLAELPEPVDPDPSPAAKVIDDESKLHVWATVAQLPSSQREAIVLRYLNDLSIDEISVITDRTPGAVRILLHRARNNLRRHYGRSPAWT